MLQHSRPPRLGPSGIASNKNSNIPCSAFAVHKKARMSMHTCRPVCSPFSVGSSSKVPEKRGRSFQISAEADGDAALDERLAKLKRGKGATPYGQRAKPEGKGGTPEQKAKTNKQGSDPPKPKYDFSDEVVYYEGSPSLGDLALNVVLGATLVWLPLTIAAVARTSIIKYRFTDKRVTITKSAPWNSEQVDLAYQEIEEVLTAGRAFGLCGDMVLVLKNKDRVDLPRLDRFLELKKYVNERKKALTSL